MDLIQRVATRHLTGMDGRVLAVLNKIRKGLKGSVDLALLPEVFEQLEGWELSEKVGVAPLADQLSGSLDKFLDPWDGYYTSSEGWCYFQFRTNEARDHVMDLVRKSSPLIGDLVGPKGPMTPEFRHLYFTEPTVGNPWNSTDPWMDRYYFKCKKAWIGVHALVLKAPNGQVGEIPILSEKKRSDFSSDRLWKFLYANGAKEQAAQILDSMGDREVRKLLAPSTVRSLEGTGTCGICLQNVKLSSGNRIMRHGWNVEGHRTRGSYGQTWHTGPCPGTDYQPYELSPKACEDYLPRLKKHREGVANHLQDLKSGKIREFYDRRDKPVPEEHPDYTYYRDSAINQTMRRLADIDSEIPAIEKRIRDWKLMPLPS